MVWLVVTHWNKFTLPYFTTSVPYNLLFKETETELHHLSKKWLIVQKNWYTIKNIDLSLIKVFNFHLKHYSIWFTFNNTQGKITYDLCSMISGHCLVTVVIYVQ